MNALSHEQAIQYLHEPAHYLSVDRQSDLAAHLAECDQCRNYADQLSALQPLLTRALRTRRYARAPEPSETAQAILQIKRRSLMRKRTITFLGAAAVAVIAMIAVFSNRIPNQSMAGAQLPVTVTPTMISSPTPTAMPTSTPPLSMLATGDPFQSPVLSAGGDRFEPNNDFDQATVIELNVKYDKLNFVQRDVNSTDWDNDFFKVRAKSGMTITCRTLDLSPGTNTNLLLYDQGLNGIEGSDDVDRARGDLSSSVTYTTTYEGWLYVLVGEGFSRSPADAQQTAYSLECSTGTTTALFASGPVEFPKIDRQPAAADWGRGTLPTLPTYNPNSDETWQVDLRTYDLSQLDLRHSLNDLLYASFDSLTKWPTADKMPPDFAWQRIMELGKNPGLGIRQLHAQGVTGKGVGIAIIDQTLLVDHQEYKDQLRLYEEGSDIQDGWLAAQMHGPAVASIAVGKNVGVAPEADLYFLATGMCSTGTHASVDFACLAQGVRRILEINQQLPNDRKIRVLSMSVGWGPERKGYQEITAAVQDAKAAGILVVSSSLEETFGFKFHALGRAPLADPEQFESYEPGLFWARDFYDNPQNRFTDRLLVPMDSRTTASPGGPNEYAFYREGGWSWSIPYIAGVYALAAQVKPSITPDEFWALALKTGRTIQLDHNGETISFGPILDPVALIENLQAK